MTELVVRAIEEIDGVTVTVGVAISPAALSRGLQGGGSGWPSAGIPDELQEAIHRRLRSEVRTLLDEGRQRLQVGLVEASLQILRGEVDRARSDHRCRCGQGQRDQVSHGADA